MATAGEAVTPISNGTTVSVKTNGAPSGLSAFPNSVRSPTSSSIVELAAIITQETEKLDSYLKHAGAPAPGFDVDSPLYFPKLPDEIKKAREEIVKATRELGDLVTGPTENLRWMAWDVSFPTLN